MRQWNWKRKSAKPAANAQYEILTFCLAHKQVLIPPIENSWLIELGPPGSVHADGFLDRINAYDSLPYGERYHPYMGGTLGSFAILKQLASWNLSEQTLINVVHYRRFTTPTAHGIPAPNFPVMQLIRGAEANRIAISDELRHISEPFLVSQPYPVTSILDQYRYVHRVVDLLRFTTCAVTLGVLDEKDAWEMFSDNTLIPGGIEYGISPVTVYRELVGKLEEVCLEYLKQYRPIDDSPYQKRALNYCCERLGSFLLRREFQNRYGEEIPKSLFGSMHVVTEEGEYVCG